MKYTHIPGTSEVVYSIEPGDLVALVDAVDSRTVLSNYYAFPETGLLEIPWNGPRTDLFMAVFDNNGDILCRFPETHTLTLTRGDVLQFHEPASN